MVRIKVMCVVCGVTDKRFHGIVLEKKVQGKQDVVTFLFLFDVFLKTLYSALSGYGTMAQHLIR